MKDIIKINKYADVWDEWLDLPYTNPSDPLATWAAAVDSLSGQTAQVMNVWRVAKTWLRRRIAPFKPIYDLTDDTELEAFIADSTAWALERTDEWLKIMSAYNTQYNPLENYNRHKEEKTTYDLDHPNTTEVTASVSPDNAESFYNTGKSTTSGGISDDGTVEIESDDTGNVGVTTSQQMLQAEIDLRMQAIYERIFIMPFINEFCIPVY